MSEPKKDEKTPEELAEMKKISDAIIHAELSKFSPDKKAVTGEQFTKSLYDKAGENIQEIEALLSNKLFNLLSEQEAETTSFSGNELKALAIKCGVSNMESLKNEEVEKILSSEEAVASSPAGNNPQTEPKSKAKQSDNARQDMVREGLKQKFKESPKFKDATKKAQEKKHGRELTDEELLDVATAETYKALMEGKVGPKNMQQQQGSIAASALGAIGKGIGALAGGVKSGVTKPFEKADKWANFDIPSTKIAKKGFVENMKSVNSGLTDIRNAIDPLSSGKMFGNKISADDKKFCQEDILGGIDKCTKGLEKLQSLADDENLPKKERLLIHEKVEEVSKMSEQLKLLPTGSSKSDKEFKESLDEKNESMADMAKNIIELIKAFFGKKGKENSMNSSPELSR